MNRTRWFPRGFREKKSDRVVRIFYGVSRRIIMRITTPNTRRYETVRRFPKSSESLSAARSISSKLYIFIHVCSSRSLDRRKRALVDNAIVGLPKPYYILFILRQNVQKRRRLAEVLTRTNNRIQFTLAPSRTSVILVGLSIIISSTLMCFPFNSVLRPERRGANNRYLWTKT